MGVRCHHELLLDADEVGKIYVNGALVVDCATGSKLVDALPAHTLFGVDFTLPSSNDGNGLPSKAILEREYGALLVDALIFAGNCDADVAGKLLNRLCTGNTEEKAENDHRFDTDMDDFDGSSNNKGSRSDERYHDDDLYPGSSTFIVCHRIDTSSGQGFSFCYTCPYLYSKRPYLPPIGHSNYIPIV